MHTLAGRLRQAFPFLGERAATEDDLLGFCAGRGVAVRFSPVVEKGIYAMRVGGGMPDFHAIALNSRLFGWSLCYVLAHEIGHYLLHVVPPRPVGRRRRGKVEWAFYDFACRKNHHEAETVAALLLLPIPELEAALLAGAFKDNSDLAALIHVRLDAWGNYGE
jgi:hypothetical protein